MKFIKTILIIISIHLLFSSLSNAQYCGIKDPSMERYASCPTSHSQLFNKSFHWFNVLNPSISTSDYYHENNTCNFGGFIAAGGISINYCKTCFRNNCQNTFYQGCGRSGIFLNYNDGSQDPKYKEYVGTRVDLIAGKQYILSIDIQRSNDVSSNTLERDLAIYGYNGSLPASQAGFCISGAVPLDTIARTLFNNDTNNTIITSFICPSNFSYLVIGAVCDGANATSIGYIYLDKILLSDISQSTLTPWIKFAGKDSRACCFSGFKNDFQLVGNKAPTGCSVLWSQKSSNPQILSFITPSDSFTNITGTGYLIPGVYDFYYSWTKLGCTMTDTLSVNVINNSRANAGADVSVCNDSNFILAATSPSYSEITTRGYLSWWSIVDPSKPGGVYHFPLLNPLSQNCLSGPGALSYALSYSPEATINPIVLFQNHHQADTFQFIWNIVDDCNNFSSDTVKVYVYQFKIETDTMIICPGDTTGYVYEIKDDSLYNSNHVNRANFYYTWSIENDSGTAHLVGGIHNDSIRLTSTHGGRYNILVDVYDSTNIYCNHYRKSITAIVRDTIKLLHPNDTTICGEDEISILQGEVPYNTEWWWDVLDYSEPDSLFTLYNPDFPYLPNDGDSNANVRAPSVSQSTTVNPRYSIFNFPFFSPQDSFTLIYNIRSACYPYELKKDTIVIRTNYIKISGGPLFTCPGDTSLYLFENNTPIRFNDPNDTSLHYYWYQIAGVGTMQLDSLSSRDSVFCTVQNIPGSYTAGLRLYDSDDSICPNLFTSFSFNVLSPIVLDSVSAGSDIHVCNGLLTPYSLIMSATPNGSTINLLGYETWWSLIDYAQPDSEYIFLNGCVPGDGFDNGTVNCGYNIDCSSSVPYSSDAPNCFFVIDDWGCYDFIWHVRYECNGNYFYKTDTVNFCWDFIEPVVNAGPDDTATCNVYQLIGNTSAASAANDGCFLWRQISSTTGTQIQIADSTNNISYLLGLDTVAQGTYYFEYTIGCGICNKKDTVAIYIPGSLPSPSIHLVSNTNSIYICKEDSVKVTASGADQYQFFVNGISVTNLSSTNIYTNGVWHIDTNVISVIAYDANTNCFSSADTSIFFILNSLDSLTIDADSILFCAGSITYLIGHTPYPSQRIFWFTESNNFTTPINLPNGTISDNPFAISPSSTTIYKATIFDSLSGCWSSDSLSIKVIPVILNTPDPHLQDDTMICTYDSVLLPITVFNQLYSGFWSSNAPSVIHFNDITNPNTIVTVPIGNYAIKWTESNLGCIGTDSFLLNIIPYPMVDAGPDTTICIGKKIKLYGSGDAENYLWKPIDSVENETILNTFTKNIYQNSIFILEGYNQICKNIDTIEITIQDCPSDIKAPSAFSPNGDGNNDFFSVFTYKMKNYEIWIFNRWGENVYYSNDLAETNDLNKGWDGRYKGITQDLGVYVYLIKAVNIYNENIELKGNITLIK